MLGAYVGAGGEIGNGAAHFQYAVVGTGTEVQSVHGGLEQVVTHRAYLANVFQQLASHLCIGIDAGVFFKSFCLYLARGYDTGAHIVAVLAGLLRGEFAEWHGGDFDMEVDTIEQGAADLVEVSLHHDG